MEFKEYKLKEICNFQEGYVNPKQTNANYFDGEIKWLRANDLQNGYVYNTSRTLTKEGFESAGKSAKLFKPNTIAISKSGTIGRLGILKDYMCGNRAVINIEGNDKIADIKYIYYFLLQNKAYIESLAQGSVQKNLYIFILEDVKIKLPNIINQRKILKILNDIDNKIELNNQINDNLYNQAVAIYKEMFQNTNQEICSIGDYLVPKRGKNLLSRDAILGNVPVIAGGLEPATYHNTSNTKAPVITISASGANAGYINLWNIPVWSSDSSYIDNDITEYVYFWYVTLKTRQKEIFDAQTGSAQPHIYPQHIAELPISKLENEDVFKYEKQVEPLFKMIGKNKEENKYLEQLRDTLLPKLMNGEINLDNIKL